LSIANQQNTSTFGGTRPFHRPLKEILLLIRRDEFRSQHKDLTENSLMELDRSSNIELKRSISLPLKGLLHLKFQIQAKPSQMPILATE
jgi:hypothetical protein